MNDILTSLIKQFMPFAQEKIGFDKPPRLFLKNDEKNASNPLGRTAYYDPQEKSVTLYISGRHPKDILRSLGHELVHHKQNCDGKFDDAGDMGKGYAQTDPHLRAMEFEANSVGSMCLRDFEDGLKKKKTIYYEHLQKGENKMSTKDWKNKELTTLLSEAWGFKFNTLQEFDEFNGTGDIQEVSDQEGEKDAEMETRGKATDAQEKDDLDVDESVSHPASDREGARADGRREKKPDGQRVTTESENNVFAPNHYCVHHGGVSHNGSTHMAEAVGHNWNKKLGKVTAYDMKLQDGTILENVAVEDIQITDASLAEGHGDHPAKRDTGASRGDDSETHPGEEDYTTKKGEKLKVGSGKRGSKPGDEADLNEDSGYDEKEHDEHNAWNDEDHIDAIEKHLRALKHDRDYEEDHESLEEGEDADLEELAQAKQDGSRRKPHKRTPVPEEDKEKDELKEAIANLLGKYIKG